MGRRIGNKTTKIEEQTGEEMRKSRGGGKRAARVMGRQREGRCAIRCSTSEAIDRPHVQFLGRGRARRGHEDAQV